MTGQQAAVFVRYRL